MSNKREFDPQYFGRWNAELLANDAYQVRWIWDSFIPWPGITLLSGASRVGKSTLLRMLLDRRREGGLLMGKAVRAGTTVVVTEEDESIWFHQQENRDFGPNVCFCRPDVDTYRRWRRFVDDLMSLQSKRSYELLVIDSLTSFLPVSENHPRLLRRVLEDLRFIDFFCVGVLLMHHPRSRGQVRSTTRGSAALPALTDVLLEMRVPGTDPFTRRRLLNGLSRYTETPQHLLVEMNPDANDYTVLADNVPDAALFAPGIDMVRGVLRSAAGPLTLDEILERWPDNGARPLANTLWTWLRRGCEAGLLLRVGRGTKNDLYRYTLAQPAAATAHSDILPDMGNPAHPNVTNPLPGQAPADQGHGLPGNVSSSADTATDAQPAAPTNEPAPAESIKAVESTGANESEAPPPPPTPTLSFLNRPSHARWVVALEEGHSDAREQAG